MQIRQNMKLQSTNSTLFIGYITVCFSAIIEQL